MSVLGIDIGGSSVKGARWDGDRWATAQSAPYAGPDRGGLLSAVRSVVDQLGGGGGTVGVCLPGRRAADGSRVVQSVNLPVLDGWAFAEMFAGFGVDPTRAVVSSDADAAGTDFVRTHGLGGRVACVVIGTGIGLSVFDDGRGVGIGGRSIGHVGLIEPEPGRSFESIVGVGAMRARFGADVRAGIDAMGAGDPAISALARLVSIVHAVYVPRVVVLMGGIGLAMRGHAGVLERQMHARQPVVADPAWTLRFGESMFHAAMGAGRIAQEG